ncbi:hypothetical protein Z960_03455 [Clostridium haemolyticum NCTC 9693]|uniref:Lipoprotein n=2 Tax=Clostridiaceae TaxID=31979 RepID=A0ABR4TI62_CLOHA|nr:hypothetical protein Z960_03455 [Clostridium haemolyticum NCTC 9693]
MVYNILGVYYMKKILSILLICIFTILLIGCSGESNETDNKEDITANIVTITQSVVKQKLKCPNTASFPWDFNEYNIKETNSTNKDMVVYNVSGYVDAENSFGAKLRNNFIVKLEFTKDLSKYRVLDINISE